jgi:hypothetical protein
MEALGTRVQVEKGATGGQITIDFFTNEDLHMIFDIIKSNPAKNPNEMLERHIESQGGLDAVVPYGASDEEAGDVHLMDDRTLEEKETTDIDADLYSIKNFSL